MSERRFKLYIPKNQMGKKFESKMYKYHIIDNFEIKTEDDIDFKEKFGNKPGIWDPIDKTECYFMPKNILICGKKHELRQTTKEEEEEFIKSVLKEVKELLSELEKNE